MRALILALIALGLLRAPATADDQRDTAERYFRTGERLFGAGEFVAAAGSFEDAFAIMPLPAIAFSAAQAYRLAWIGKQNPAHLQRAAELYRRYLEDAPKGPRVVDASAALGELEAVLRGQGGAGAGPAAVRATGVAITSSIAAVEVALDGGEAAPLPIVRDLAAGKHALVASAPGYAGTSMEFQVVDGVVVPVEVDLAPLPALVTIVAEAGSEIAVDGRTVGRAPLPPLPLAAGRHHVAVSRRGRVGFGQDLDVARGQVVALRARQSSTRQRRAARWTLLGAGVLAVGTGVATTAALLADRDASDLAAQQASVGLTLDERARYEALRGQRDDRRAVGLGLGGAAVAVGVTGALLFWLDRDVAERAPTIAPTVTGDGGGVTWSGRF